MLKRPTAVSFRRLSRDDMDGAARVHRAAFDERLPWLAGLHTPGEDRAYFQNQVFAQCEVWGAIGAGLTGFIAFRRRWIDQFYVLPARQGQGVGEALLTVAKAAFSDLQLWTFQRNAPASRISCIAGHGPRAEMRCWTTTRALGQPRPDANAKERR